MCPFVLLPGMRMERNFCRTCVKRKRKRTSPTSPTTIWSRLKPTSWNENPPDARWRTSDAAAEEDVLFNGSLALLILGNSRVASASRADGQYVPKYWKSPVCLSQSLIERNLWRRPWSSFSPWSSRKLRFQRMQLSGRGHTSTWTRGSQSQHRTFSLLLKKRRGIYQHSCLFFYLGCLIFPVPWTSLKASFSLHSVAAQEAAQALRMTFVHGATFHQRVGKFMVCKIPAWNSWDVFVAACRVRK